MSKFKVTIEFEVDTSFDTLHTYTAIDSAIEHGLDSIWSQNRITDYKNKIITVKEIL